LRLCRFRYAICVSDSATAAENLLVARQSGLKAWTFESLQGPTAVTLPTFRL
jgi:hypothetical protein